MHYSGIALVYLGRGFGLALFPIANAVPQHIVKVAIPTKIVGMRLGHPFGGPGE